MRRPPKAEKAPNTGQNDCRNLKNRPPITAKMSVRAAIPIKKGVAAIIAMGLLHTICSDITHDVDDNSEGVRIVSLFGVAALEPAPFAQHRTLLVVAKGYSVTGPMGGYLPPRLCQERAVFPEGRTSKLAEDKLARLLHEFANKCQFYIIGLRGEIDV